MDELINVTKKLLEEQIKTNKFLYMIWDETKKTNKLLEQKKEVGKI